MDHQWRSRSIQGNVCPVCSIPHLPFCPPPLPYYPPSRFPFEGDPSFQRSAYPGPPGMHGSYVANRNDGFADPSFWHRNPNWDKPLPGQPPFQYPGDSFRPPLYEQGPPNDYVGESDRNFKRPRVGEDSSGSAIFSNDFDKNPARNLSEDERRLKLVRDHGVALGKPPEDPSFGGPGRLNQNGFHSDVNQGVFCRDEKDVVPHSQNSGFLQFQHGHLRTSQQHMPWHQANDALVAHGPGYSLRDDWQGTIAPYPEQTANGDPNKLLPQSFGPQKYVQVRHDFHSSAQSSNATLPHEFNFSPQEGNQTQVGRPDISGVSQRGTSNLNGRSFYSPYSYASGSSNFSENRSPMEASRIFHGQPPLPSSPPPPLPFEPPMSQPKAQVSLFPVSVSSSAVASSPYPRISEAHSLPQPNFPNKSLPQPSTVFPLEETSKQFLGDAKPFSLKQLSDDKPKFITASHLFKHPHRTTRPDHIVIVLRGLPGSGKSYLAKMLRDLEVENGGDAPRIHSMDDYFMTEVEKVDDNDTSKSSSSGRGKKPVMKKVMEYCYEPEMEEAYRSSMLKAFKKNVEEGAFTFIIVDDRNLRVADFAQFWATAKRSGYEVYILEATYKDPAGCAARNVHGFTQEDIEKMAGQWEEAPSLYLQLDVKSLFHGDDLRESRILEVDMDMEDDIGDALPVVQGREDEKIVDPSVRDDNSDGSLLEGKRWDAEEHPTEVRELGKCKWSEEFDEDENDRTEGGKGNISALSGLIHAYGKEGKSVHWADQVGDRGFSIGATKKANVSSLVIGPGAGYNLKSNPLTEEESPTTSNSAEPKKYSIFQERMRAERESFKAVFDRRRQRISGLDVDED
ncbi:hypothetical protein QN277_025440 [Acacia crassicarpa]|uniref:YLP motif-containing protein 1 n=1 Tax=Acacia crassicarpa TaxID=499986 RepID=A0AAE1MEB2_9FABA|nr:hypothetical protein QN277_025440 [Acacia crassicarpa]